MLRLVKLRLVSSLASNRSSMASLESHASATDYAGRSWNWERKLAEPRQTSTTAQLVTRAGRKTRTASAPGSPWRSRRRYNGCLTISRGRLTRHCSKWPWSATKPNAGTSKGKLPRSSANSMVALVVRTPPALLLRLDRGAK